MTDDELGALGISRRNFFKKMVAIGFAVPILTSFALDGVAAANDDRGGMSFGNQTNFDFLSRGGSEVQFFPNQTRFDDRGARRDSFSSWNGSSW